MRQAFPGQLTAFGRHIQCAGRQTCHYGAQGIPPRLPRGFNRDLHALLSRSAAGGDQAPACDIHQARPARRGNAESIVMAQ
jgi:hypothetical protein